MTSCSVSPMALGEGTSSNAVGIFLITVVYHRDEEDSWGTIQCGGITSRSSPGSVVNMLQGVAFSMPHPQNSHICQAQTWQP